LEVRVAEVRTAIAAGDRSAALKLLRAHVQGHVDLSTVPNTLADALVETAGRLHGSDVPDTTAAAVHRANHARERVIYLITHSGFTSADLAEIRRVLDTVEADPREDEDRARRDDLRTPADAEVNARRVGSVWLELKYIPDPDSDRQYGPYLYGRWHENGRKRSRYIGKP
jgi:hypothetical protein